MTPEEKRTLRTLIDHELQNIQDAHYEGDIGWDDNVIIRKTLMDHESMFGIHAAETYNGYPNDLRKGDRVMPLRVWKDQVRNLRGLLR